MVTPRSPFDGTLRRNISGWRAPIEGGLWWQRLYVDPVTGLLCRTDKLPEERARRRARRNKVATPITAGGESPFESWFSDLDAAAAAKVSIALVRLGQGNTSNAKSVGEGVLEYRIDWGPGYRVYLGRDGETLVILLTGGTKQRQRRDIERAKELWTDYKRRRKPPTQ